MPITPCDILITGGIVVTMDPQRQVLEDGAVAISDGRLVTVGSPPHVPAIQERHVLDAQRQAVLPGLIDGHGHAEHGLVKRWEAWR